MIIQMTPTSTTTGAIFFLFVWTEDTCLSCIVERHLNVFLLGAVQLDGPPNAQVHQIWSLLDSGYHYEFNRTQDLELTSGEKCHGSLALACSYDYEDCECVCNVVFVVQKARKP